MYQSIIQRSHQFRVEHRKPIASFFSSAGSFSESKSSRRVINTIGCDGVCGEPLEPVGVQSLETALEVWQVEASTMGVVRERYLGRMMARLD
jgi:hypothetical protein